MENSQVLDPQEMFPLALTYRPLVQPPIGLFPSDINEIVFALIKIVGLEKVLKKSQGFNSIPNTGDGHTEASIRLLEKFKMPHIDKFNGSGDSIVHVCLFYDVLRPMGLSRVQKLPLFGRTLSNVAAIW